MSAYYPVLLSIASLLVCFWAEVFHIPGVRTERTGFLSKSYVGFLTFNALTYSVFVTETILLALSSEEGQTSLLIRVFNGLYAALLFVVVVFFLIYGVEVYFKVSPTVGQLRPNYVFVPGGHSVEPQGHQSLGRSFGIHRCNLGAMMTTPGKNGLSGYQSSQSEALLRPRDLKDTVPEDQDTVPEEPKFPRPDVVCGQEVRFSHYGRGGKWGHGTIVQIQGPRHVIIQEDNGDEVRGGFLQPSPTAPFPLQVLSLEERTKENTTSTPGGCGETQQNQTPEEQLPMSFGPQRPPIHPLSLSQVNPGQLHQSRFGLVFQAFVLLSTVGFLLSDILGTFWKDKVPVVSRNWHSIVFRLVEVAATLWFPCCLWNSLRPDQLWILNPKRVLRRPLEPHWGADEDRDAGEESDGSDEPECWICFDRGSQNSPLIQPCRCRGGVGAVHHEC
ncbi:unnamed protein product, partial [Cyprideis torosa]